MLFARPGLTKEFVVSYAGESEYDIGGRRYSVRHFANCNPRFGYAAGVLEQSIIPLVGCVIPDGYPAHFEFPPADVVALFPGFVGARFTRPNPETGAPGYAVEYDGAEPVKYPCPRVPDYMTCDAAEENLRKFGMW